MLISRLALKIVVMTREQGTGNRFWATLLFVTYSSFRRFKPDFDYLLPLRLPYFASLRETKTVVHLPEIRCMSVFFHSPT
jgi:hypothetical protein